MDAARLDDMYATRETTGSVLLTVLVLETSTAYEIDAAREMSAQSPSDMAAGLLRLRIMRSVASALRSLRIESILDTLRPDFRLDLDLPFRTVESVELDALRRIGVDVDERRLAFATEIGTIHIEFELLEEVNGSLLRTLRTKITVFARSAIGGAVIAGVMVNSIWAAGPWLYEHRPGTGAPPAYVCTIDAVLDGDATELFKLAQRDLEMPDGASKEVERDVIKARQRCLAAAGMDPGPIDGDAGRQTEGAEQRFTARYGVAVNWNSEVFRRFVIQMASIQARVRR